MLICGMSKIVPEAGKFNLIKESPEADSESHLIEKRRSRSYTVSPKHSIIFH